MIIDRYRRMDIGIGSVPVAVPAENQGTQGIGILWQVANRVSLGLHFGQRVEQGFEYGQEGCGSRRPGIWGEIEQNNRNFLLRPFGLAQGDDFLDPANHDVDLNRIRDHGAAAFHFSTTAPTIDTGGDHAIQFRDRDHDRCLKRHQSLIRSTPLIQGLEFQRMTRQAGDIQPSQHFRCGDGVVIGWPANQREPGQADHCIHRRLAILLEEFLHSRARIQTIGKGRDRPQAAPFKGRNHAVIMTCIPRQNIGPQQDQTNAAFFRHGHFRQIRNIGDSTRTQAGVIQTNIWIIDGRGGLNLGAQGQTIPGCAGLDQEAHQAGQVHITAGQPILHDHEIGPHILGGPWNIFQNGRQAAQHRHPVFTGIAQSATSLLRLAGDRLIAFPVFLTAGPFQLFQQIDGRRRLCLHVKPAQARQLHDFCRRHTGNHRIAVFPARQQIRHNGLDLIFNKQHRHQNDITRCDIRAAGGQSLFGFVPIDGGVEFQIKTGQFLFQHRAGAVHCPAQHAVEADNHNIDRDGVIVRNALLHYTMSLK